MLLLLGLYAIHPYLLERDKSNVQTDFPMEAYMTVNIKIIKIVVGLCVIGLLAAGLLTYIG